MKAKRISTGEEVEVSELTFTSMKTGVVHRRDIKNGGFIAESDLEFLPDTPEEVTIEGWVLRDDNNKIGIYRDKPTCDEDGWDLTGEHYDLFPDITPDMLPKKYRISITPME